MDARRLDKMEGEQETMTLDDAISYYDEVAEKCRRKANIERNDYMDLKDNASEAKQLADWLNELKLLRDRIEIQPEPCDDFVKVVRCKKCRYVHYDKEFDNYWCNRMSGAFMVEAEGFCKWGR